MALRGGRRHSRVALLGGLGRVAGRRRLLSRVALLRSRRHSRVALLGGLSWVAGRRRRALLGRLSRVAGVLGSGRGSHGRVGGSLRAGLGGSRRAAGGLSRVGTVLGNGGGQAGESSEGDSVTHFDCWVLELER